MKYYNLFKFSVFALFVQSMFIWVTWNIPIGLFHMFVLFILYLFVTRNHIRVHLHHGLVAFLLGITLFYQCLRAGAGFSTWGSTALLFAIYIYIMGLPKILYGDMLSFITKWMAIILLPSLIVHIIVMITGIQSPFVLTSYEDSYGVFQNYFVYIHLVSEIVFRFNGPFLEPGHLGMITSFLLFANNFNLKDRAVGFIFLCNILTFSMAGYLLTFSGWLLLYSLKKEKVISLALLLVALNVGISYVPQDSLFYEVVLSRLEIENGELSGDNRITADGDYYYNQLLKSDDWLFGYGINLRDDRVRGSGIKLYILRNGILGVVLWVTILLLLALKSQNKKYALIFFFVCCLSLYQRFYPYWFSWFFTYYAAINMYQESLINKINNKAYASQL